MWPFLLPQSSWAWVSCWSTGTLFGWLESGLYTQTSYSSLFSRPPFRESSSLCLCLWGHRSLLLYWIIPNSNTNVLLCHPNYTNKSLEPTSSVRCIPPQFFERLVCTNYLHFFFSLLLHLSPHSTKTALPSSHTTSRIYKHTSLLSAASDTTGHSTLPETLSFLGIPLVFLLPLWPVLSHCRAWTLSIGILQDSALGLLFFRFTSHHKWGLLFLVQ